MFYVCHANATQRGAYAPCLLGSNKFCAAGKFGDLRDALIARTSSPAVDTVHYFI